MKACIRIRTLPASYDFIHMLSGQLHTRLVSFSRWKLSGCVWQNDNLVYAKKKKKKSQGFIIFVTNEWQAKRWTMPEDTSKDPHCCSQRFVDWGLAGFNIQAYFVSLGIQFHKYIPIKAEQINSSYLFSWWMSCSLYINTLES